jgi:hypothetical protein
VIGGGTFAEGSSRTVTAMPNGDHTFVHWTESGRVVSTSENYTFTLNGTVTLVADHLRSANWWRETGSRSQASIGLRSGTAVMSKQYGALMRSRSGLMAVRPTAISQGRGDMRTTSKARRRQG